MLPRVYAWFRAHPRWADGLLAAVLFALSTLAVSPRSRIVPLVVVLVVPLVVRREYPTAVLLWIFGIGVLQLVFSWHVQIYDFSIIIAIYSVTAYGPRWAIRVGLWGGLLGGILAAFKWSSPPDPTARYIGLSAVCAPVVIAWSLAANLRTRRAYLCELEERADRLERERDTQARIAVAQERARIARELHDVVAHNVSVIVVQADGAECALADGDLGDTAQAISAIGRTGRTALAEMRLLLGVLRQAEPEQEIYAPQPGLAGLSALADQVPLPVKIITVGDTSGAPPGVGLTAYRIVQEAITNTIKHAGPDASVTVRLERLPAALRIVVDDDGRGLVEDGRPPGQGLLGMRERVALFGGRVSALGRPEGGFRVQAELPWEPA